jgi:hypothetical protein
MASSLRVGLIIIILIILILILLLIIVMIVTSSHPHPLHHHDHTAPSAGDVTRLRLGDPFLFGRGGWEGLEYRRYGVEPQVGIIMSIMIIMIMIIMLIIIIIIIIIVIIIIIIIIITTRPPLLGMCCDRGLGTRSCSAGR